MTEWWYAEEKQVTGSSAISFLGANVRKLAIKIGFLYLQIIQSITAFRAKRAIEYSEILHDSLLPL